MLPIVKRKPSTLCPLEQYPFSHSETRLCEHQLLLIYFFNGMKMHLYTSTASKYTTSNTYQLFRKLVHFSAAAFKDSNIPASCLDIGSLLEVTFLMDSLLGVNANADELKVENTVTTSDVDSFTDNCLWRHLDLAKQTKSLSLNITI